MYALWQGSKSEPAQGHKGTNNAVMVGRGVDAGGIKTKHNLRKIEKNRKRKNIMLAREKKIYILNQEIVETRAIK